MTEKEILRQQLELLAEESRKAEAKDLPALTNAMVLLYSTLSNDFSLA